jgi:hypothetical protein
MTPSTRRQRALDTPDEAATVRRLYDAACARWGRARVHASPSLVWTLRVMEAMTDALPWDATVSRTAGELRWVARHVLAAPLDAGAGEGER